MATFKPYPFLLGFIVLFCFVRPTLAFGAGNIAGISSVEGQNCRVSPPPRHDSPAADNLSNQGVTETSRMPSSRLSWPAPPAASTSTS
jgi:hypothetical protein